MATSQRCKVQFGDARMPIRHYLLVGPDGDRYMEVWNKVSAEYRKPDLERENELAALYWIDTENDEILMDSQEAYDSALSYLVPDHAGICFLKLFAKSKATGAQMNGRRVDIPSSTAARQVRQSAPSPSPHVTRAPTTSPIRPVATAPVVETASPVATANRNRTRSAGLADLVAPDGPLAMAALRKSLTAKPKWFRCQKCKLSFTTNNQLKLHAAAAHVPDEPRVLRRDRKKRHSVSAATLSGPVNGENGLNGGVQEEEDKRGVQLPEARTVESSKNLDVESVEKEEEESPADGKTAVTGTEAASAGGNFPCQKCDRVFESAKSLRGHQTAHSALRHHRRLRKARPMKKTTTIEQLNGMEVEGDEGEEVFRTVAPVAIASDEGSGAQADSPMDLTQEDQKKSREDSREKSPEIKAEDSGSSRKTLLKEVSLLHVEQPLHQCEKCERAFLHIRQLRGHQAAHADSNTNRRKRKKKRGTSSNNNSAAIYEYTEMTELPTMVPPPVSNGGGDTHSTPNSSPAKKRRRSSSTVEKKMTKVAEALRVNKSLSGLEQTPNDTAVDNGGSGKLSCTKCDRLFDTKRQLQGHQALHSNKGKFVCPLCSQGFRTREVLDAHQIDCTGVVPPEVKTYSCVPACGRLFNVRKTLTQHRLICGFYRECTASGGGGGAEDSGDDVANGYDNYADDGHMDNGTSHDLDDSIEIPDRSLKAVTPVPFADDLPSVTATPTTEKEPLDMVTVPLRQSGQREKLILPPPTITTRKHDDSAVADSNTSNGALPKYFIAL